jgi:carboxylesterase
MTGIPVCSYARDQPDLFKGAPVPVLPGAEPFGHDGSADLGALLCHGFTGSPQGMRGWGEYLATEGFTTRCPLLPGHGTTWRDANRTTWTDWYGALSGALDELTERCASVIVCGLSMGGTLALRLAETRGPEVAGLVLVNPSVTTLRKDATLAPLLAKVLPSMPPIAGDIAKPGVTELSYDRLPLKAFVQLRSLWKVVRADLAQVSCPVLVFRSAQDHVVEPVSTELVLAGVASADRAEVVLPDSYHVATLDHDAETIFKGSVEFARRISTGQAEGGDGRGR